MTRSQAKRQKLIQMAEGYLDLTMVFDDRWPLDVKLRRVMADRAIDCLNHVVRPLGYKPYVLFLKGQAHRTAGRYKQAVRFFEQSLKLDPDNLHSCLAIAWCYKRTDQLDKAIEAMQWALQIDSSSAISHYNLACYGALQENLELAIHHLSLALELNEDYRDFIASESDFDLIRDNPDFQALITVSA